MSDFHASSSSEGERYLLKITKNAGSEVCVSLYQSTSNASSARELLEKIVACVTEAPKTRLGIRGFCKIQTKPMLFFKGKIREEASGGSDSQVHSSFTSEEMQHFQSLAPPEKNLVLDELAKVKKQSPVIPLKLRLLLSPLSLEVKRKVLQRLEKQKDSLFNGEAIKYNAWLEAMLSAAALRTLVPVSLEVDDVRKHLLSAARHLDKILYGQRAAKQAVLERFFLWLKNPLVAQRPLALQGPPGTGKTSLVKEGLAQIMGRPFNLIALGGLFDSSYLLGHSYTYEGSCQGRLVDALTASDCRNPVIFFDELDKCSGTPKGEEIVNTLVHLTDVMQNHCIRDRYLAGLDIDFSAALLVFSYNDDSKISGILLDRLQIVRMDPLSPAEQRHILSSFLLPSVLKERGLDPNFARISSAASEEAVELLRRGQGGIRELRNVVEQAITKLSMLRDTGDESLILPLKRGHLRETEQGFEVLEGAFWALLQSNPSASTSSHMRMYV